MSEEERSVEQEVDTLEMTVRIVSAYVGNNSVPTDQVSHVINTIHSSLQELSGAAAESAIPLKPAVPIRRSITPDYIVCLEDGKKLKMLKRHIRAVYGLTPEEYRAKWGLPADYPMVAPNYARQRSAFAKQIGLGRKKGETVKKRNPS